MSENAKLHPTGWFNLTIEENGINKAGTGTSSVRLVIKPIDPQYPLFYKDLWLTTNAVQKTAEQLRAAGYTGSNFEDFRKNPKLLAGNTIRCQVIHETYQKDDGTMAEAARIGWINDPNRRAVQQSTDAIDNLDALNAVLRTVAAGKTSPTATTSNGSSTVQGDVPF